MEAYLARGHGVTFSGVLRLPCENIGVLEDGLVAGGVLPDGQHTPPLGKVTSISLELLASLVQVI